MPINQERDPAHLSQLLTRLEVENPSLYEQYQASVEAEFYFSMALIGIGIGIVLLPYLVALYLNSIFPIFYMFFLLFIYIKTFNSEKFVNEVFGDIKIHNEILNSFEEKMINSENRSKDEINKVREIISEKESIVLGDQIIAHAGATIINRSQVVNSFNEISNDDPELARAILNLAAYIEESKNEEAGQLISDLASEVNGEKRVSHIRAFWNEIVRILPEITKLTESVTILGKLFV